jgi:hypothetical protein
VLKLEATDDKIDASVLDDVDEVNEVADTP